MSFGFTFDREVLTLYFHSANEGKKLEFLRGDPVVCFEMDAAGQFTMGDRACSGSLSYQSVIGWGKAEFITGAEEKAGALRSILDHYTGKSEHEFSKAALDETAVFKVVSNEYTGKQLQR
jgi:nitroimidazol reductase NimA-like FMN-containing flavoprotein (pyridoxamine 5'-phosphate oxidase superfamily)